jgi:hypothetical protein
MTNLCDSSVDSKFLNSGTLFKINCNLETLPFERWCFTRLLKSVSRCSVPSKQN